MNKIILVALSLTLILIGCKSTYEPSYVGAIIEVKESELNNYWVRDPTKIKMLSRRPDWLPKGEGKGTYSIVIDSNGNEITKELVSSTPDGWMTQKHLNKIPKIKYKPSQLNAQKTPVKVQMSFEVKRMG
ncbi:conserved hypothetical protein [Shewanella halifaxensis HAW-EB4]|uniref:TonB family protein n=1 Tax=Shewanella halifaxensis (strain HAW-EB4) TaxID=458817 RepID=B0TS82_SHEHH|nr:hypothetical protein [Shewanella halifaxensis]ABZ75217.1 conserved hypothetical protein [Shewanella halifaxensis HAW-EB4]